MVLHLIIDKTNKILNWIGVSVFQQIFKMDSTQSSSNKYKLKLFNKNLLVLIF